MISKCVARSDDPRWRPWKVAVGAVAIQRLIVFTVGYAANAPAARLLHTRSDSGLSLWDQWDATHFLWVAQHGYATSPAQPYHHEAFFPLFPLLVRAVTAFGIAPIAAALAINTLALVVACRYLYELGEDSIGAGLGTRAVLFLVLFPTAVFLVVPYSEALFLAGAVPSFLFARRGRWLPAGFAAAVAIASRPLGIFLVAGLAVEFVRRRRFSRQEVRSAVVAFAIAILPLVFYGWYLWSTRGSPIYFLTAERLSWQRTFVGPVASISNTIDNMLSSIHADPGRFGGVRQLWRIVKPVGEIIAMILAVVVTVWSLLRREWGWVTFVGLTVLALATSTYYYSVPRMLLSLFPVMLFLAAVTRSHRATYIAMVSVSLIGLCFGTVLFTHRLWFY
jgi:uncharacterized Tic20 family protein